MTCSAKPEPRQSATEPLAIPYRPRLPNPLGEAILLTIVIPSFNSEKYLDLCLQSLRACKSPEVECIFIDGGSADSTMSIVKRYENLFSFIVSEKDRGQSHALNKGFSKARGKYLTWLNADDCFVPSEFRRLMLTLCNGEANWYACNQIYVNNTDTVVKFLGSGAFESWALRFGVLHVFGPSTIFSRELYRKYGPFSELFNYSMDSEYWRRLASAGIRYKRLKLYLWAFRLHDDSKTSASITDGKNSAEMCAETKLIDEMYVPGLTPRMKQLGVTMARVNRILNGSYITSLWLTFRYRGEKRTRRWA
jgi:glycosyltransferase involved in cell wall biosynthesis